MLQSAVSSELGGSVRGRSVYVEEGSTRKRAVVGREGGQYMGGEEGRSVEPTTSPLAAP